MIKIEHERYTFQTKSETFQQKTTGIPFPKKTADELARDTSAEFIL